MSVIVENPVWYGVLVELPVLMPRPFDLGLMSHVHDCTYLGPRRCQSDEPFVFHESVISWLYLPSTSIKQCLLLPLLELSMSFEGRAVAFFGED